MRAIYLTILITALATRLPAQEQSRCGVADLPLQAREVVSKKYPDWRVKTTSDLEAYDKKLWAEEHPKDCPGIALGRFEEPKPTRLRLATGSEVGSVGGLQGDRARQLRSRRLPREDVRRRSRL
jgi:hypothetical protein